MVGVGKEKDERVQHISVLQSVRQWLYSVEWCQNEVMDRTGQEAEDSSWACVREEEKGLQEDKKITYFALFSTFNLLPSQSCLAFTLALPGLYMRSKFSGLQ